MAVNVRPLSDADFETEVIKADLPVLVDFWASWCGPCKMVAPIVEEIAKDYDGKIKVGKVNVDENNQTPANYGIMSIPTLLLFKEGQLVDRVVGFRPREELEQFIGKVL